MKQEAEEFSTLKTKKALKDRQHWEKIKKRGHLPFIALNILMWLGSYAIVRVLHVLCFRLGWLHSPGSNSLEDIFICAIVAGAISGQVYWSDMKRKFDILPPGEDWTMK